MKKKLIYIFIILLFIGACITQGVTGNHSNNSFNIQSNDELPNIMLTGYWNPTGLMIAPFSNNTYINPDGWKGENWEELGYNIYSFFPTPGIFNGTLEVDYQDTWNDFWEITDQVHPIAIISFGAGDGPWEIEFNARNLDGWIPDDEFPKQPIPCPPDNTVPKGYVRHSTLPMREIEDAVNAQTSVQAWIDWINDPGAFLCGYIAYLGMWYQATHSDIEESYPCLAAGFIHVKPSVTVADAMEATNITIRETIKYLSHVSNSPETPNISGPSSGNVEVEYMYNANTKDFDGDNVSYLFDWGDGTNSGWIDFVSSGTSINVSHIWTKRGDYEIKVKALDTYGRESDWATLEISMPKSKSINDFNPWVLRLIQRFPILQYFL